MPSVAPNKRKLGDLLVSAELLTEEELQRALRSKRPSERLGETVVRMGMCREHDVATTIARQLRLRVADLQGIKPDKKALAQVEPSLAFRHHALPLRYDPQTKTLLVAVDDPTNAHAVDDIRLAASARKVQLQVASRSAIHTALVKAYGSARTGGSGGQQLSQDLAGSLITDAARRNASDIHLEAAATGLRVRYRIDGALREAKRVPDKKVPGLISRIKLLGDLDIAEKRQPQDGRTTVTVDGQTIDLRISTLPSVHGETVVVRLLHKDSALGYLDDLGVPDEQVGVLRQAFNQPQGLILVCGPTGSGKTSTLYAGIREVNDPTRRISTLEDPVELQLPGVTQTQVDVNQDLTFAAGLRSLLRQDPDVILVGEIRDTDTAQMAVRAATTGHLVLSTLHSLDAVGAISRLADLDVDRSLLASTLQVVVAQRLVRLNCGRCAQPDSPDEDTLQRLGLRDADLADADLLRGSGCEQCGNTGFRGRIGVFELMAGTPTVRELIVADATHGETVRFARQEGMRSLREDAVAKALEGRTTLAEVLRATPDHASKTTHCPNCTKLVPGSVEACPFCSQMLVPHPCEDCGQQLEPEWSHCPTCVTSR